MFVSATFCPDHSFHHYYLIWPINLAICTLRSSWDPPEDRIEGLRVTQDINLVILHNFCWCNILPKPLFPSLLTDMTHNFGYFCSETSFGLWEDHLEGPRGPQNINLVILHNFCYCNFLLRPLFPSLVSDMTHNLYYFCSQTTLGPSRDPIRTP